LPAAVVFDLDGVLVDSEERWNEAREALTRESGGTWTERATRDMMGMSAPEWSAYLRDELGVPLSEQEINDEVVARLKASLRDDLPLLPGAVQAVRALADRWPLGLASSANGPVIALVLERAGLATCFRATVSSEEVARGKPAPDVYLEAARRLGVEADECVAVEDSTNGLRSAHAAGMAVIAVPNRAFPPEPDAVDLAAEVVDSVSDVTPELVERAGAGRP
jgi:HAD superfamily hydrolase (TIGR01509 family)